MHAELGSEGAGPVEMPPSQEDERPGDLMPPLQGGTCLEEGTRLSNTGERLRAAGRCRGGRQC